MQHPRSFEAQPLTEPRGRRRLITAVRSARYLPVTAPVHQGSTPLSPWGDPEPLFEDSWLLMCHFAAARGYALCEIRSVSGERAELSVDGLGGRQRGAGEGVKLMC